MIIRNHFLNRFKRSSALAQEANLIAQIDLLASNSSYNTPLYILIDYDKTLVTRDVFFEAIILCFRVLPLQFIISITREAYGLLMNDLLRVGNFCNKSFLKFLIARAIKRAWPENENTISLLLFHKFYNQRLVQALMRARCAGNVHIIVVTNNVTLLTAHVCEYLGFGLVALDNTDLFDLLKPIDSKSVRLKKQHPDAIRLGLMLTITDRYFHDIDLLRLPPKSCILFDKQLQLFFSWTNGALK